MYALHPCFLQDFCVWNLVLPLVFNSFLKHLKWKWLTLFAWHWYTVQVSHADFQLCVKLDSISLQDISMESSESHTGCCNSGSDHISVHYSGESVSQVGGFINNFHFLSIHSDDWFIVRFFQALVGVQPFLC